MKHLALILTLVVSGCSTVNTVLSSHPPLCPGTRAYDPQICRGEKFTRLPNFTNEAQRIMERCGSIGADCPGAK